MSCSKSTKSTKLTAVEHSVSQDARNHKFGHSGGVVWLTDLSASGKSTLAMALEARLMGAMCLMVTTFASRSKNG
jgi:adenylylsulfate kinase-like enzyme